MRRPTVLLALFAALAVLHTWPLAGDIAGLSRLDNDDAGLNVWILAWVTHILPRDPLHLFDAPIFFPEPRTLAYSEHMLVPSLMGAPLVWAGIDPVVVYNLLAIAGLALSGWTMCLVMIRWTDSTTAAVAAGMLYAFNAHLLTRFAHLQALHVEFLPLALYALDGALTRGDSVGVPASAPSAALGASVSSAPSAVLGASVSSASSAALGASAPSAPSAALAAVPSAALASAFVLQALCSNYTLVFLSVALFVAALVRAPEWIGPGRRARARTLLVAGVFAIVAVGPFLWPYYVVSREQGLTRSIEEVRLYAAGWQDYLATGGRLHYAWWSHRFFEGRTALFPGVVGAGLAGLALVRAGAWLDRRMRMAAAIGAVGLALSFGPALPGYAWLHSHVPLFEGLRGVARWGFLFLTAVAILAGHGVAWLERRFGRWAYWPAAALALLGFITLEALRAPMTFTPVEVIPAIYHTLQVEANAVLVEFPLYHGRSVSENARYMVAGTRHFRPLVNGYSGFEPEAFRRRAERWRQFPSAPVLDEMRALGVTHVMLHLRELDADQVNGAANTPGLALLHADGDRRLYRVRP